MREEQQEEEEAVTSNGMNDDDKANINSRSDLDNNRIGDGDDNCNLNQISQVWGTWEELVLTCAVKRHGLSDWDSVAKEVQTRSRSSSLTAVSAGNCSLKYQDLKRRFQDSGDDGERNSEAAAAAEEDGVGEITWIEKLRKLRVVELRREVQRCDDSIRSLQIKVKKLEEEKEGDDGDKKPDLKDDAKAVKSRSNEIDEPAKINRETTESDRENRSMNESNSTASVDKIADHERLRGDKTIQACKNSKNPDPDPVNKAAGEEEGTVSMRSGMSHSGELVESGTSTVPAKKKTKKYRSGEDSGIRGGSGGDIKSTGNKSQPLIEIIKLIRSHPRGSVFESRLRSQETKDYKRLIKQHLDIKTIEKKLKKGAYVSSSNLCFYRDIKLLFTNAIVFFPPSSSESKAAHELRTLVSNEIKKQTRKPVIKTEPVLSVSKQKSSVPPLPSLVVCKKKKSSDFKKTTSPSSSSFKQRDEKKKKSQEVSEEKKTVITTTTSGARSSRKTNDVVVKDNKTGRGNKKQTESKADSSDDDDDDKEESRKTEKKKKTVEVDKKKKKSVVDFLKRIEKNSPEKEKEIRMSKEHHDQQKKKSDGIGNGKKESNGKSKPRELRSSSTGKNNGNNKSSSKQQRKEPREETAEASTGKRSRESSGKEDKQPKKRSRR